MTPNTPTPSATAPAGQGHTATPWHAVKHDDTQWAICYGGSDFACVAVTSQGNDEANAAHIVHCVNTHSQILAQNAALKAAVECADAYELRDDWREVLVRYGWREDEMVASIFIRKLRRDVLKLVAP